VCCCTSTLSINLCGSFGTDLNGPSEPQGPLGKCSSRGAPEACFSSIWIGADFFFACRVVARPSRSVSLQPLKTIMGGEIPLISKLVVSVHRLIVIDDWTCLNGELALPAKFRRHRVHDRCHHAAGATTTRPKKKKKNFKPARAV